MLDFILQSGHFFLQKNGLQNKFSDYHLLWSQFILRFILQTALFILHQRVPTAIQVFSVVQYFESDVTDANW